MEDGITLKGSLSIRVDITVNDGAVCKVDNANDHMKFERNTHGFVHRPKIAGSGSLDVSAGTLTFEKCDLDYQSSPTWNLSGGTIHVTSDCDCGGESYDYTACDIDIQAGTLEVDNTFKTNGNVDLSGGTLQVDEQFTGKGELDFSGGTIKVAANKIAAFTPND